MKKFSIIVPVYNIEKYLNRCLDSLVSQSFKSFEVIIVCDKCNDKSETIVDKYVNKNKNFKKIYSEKTGLSKARNIGVNASNGKYILFLDGDDYFELKLLEILNKTIVDEDLIRFQVRNIKENKKINYKELSFDTCEGVKAFELIVKYHYVENAWTYCYNSKFYKKNHFMFMQNCIAEDYGLIPLIIGLAQKVKAIDFIGYNYVERTGSLMTSKNYNKKIKKMEDMLRQSRFLKKRLEKIDNNETLLGFINNSLIYYVTTLKYKDYLRYNKIIKGEKCFDTIKTPTFKSKIKKIMLKTNAYLFYKYVVR
ncbi:MAG: glycosyltransferase family 2 protein [Romboutsia sp.]